MTTANAPETAMPTLRLSRRASDQSEQHAWPATECVARNSVTSSSKDSPSVAASVANQSPGGANTSNPAPVLVFLSGRLWSLALVRDAEREPKQSTCRALRPLQAPCDLQHVMKHGSPQPSFLKEYISVQTWFFLGNRPAA